ncbi:MAG: nucleotide pyrophosphohydrolase [Bacillota bacterium]
MNEINLLMEEVIRFRDERNWARYHTPKDLAMSIAIEAAELMEIFQWKNLQRDKLLQERYRLPIQEEIADVAIYLLILSHDLGIDLAEAIRRKLAANARKYPAGKSDDLW